MLKSAPKGTRIGKEKREGVAKSKERRKSVICPYCRHEMVCMNRFESIYNLIRGFYIWYICPRRKGEDGCGHSMLLEISSKAKCPNKVVRKV